MYDLDYSWSLKFAGLSHRGTPGSIPGQCICLVFGGQSGTGTGLTPSNSTFPC